MDIDPIAPSAHGPWAARLASTPARESAGGAAAMRAPRPVDRKTLERHVKQANGELAALQKDLRISIHEDSGEMVVQIVDPRSGNVLRQSPPEEFLNVSVRLHEMVGFFLDAKS
jgi:flagellar protein FlaG